MTMPVITRSQSCMLDTPQWDEPDLNAVDVINYLVPGEKHWPGTNYLGPGTNLAERLQEDGITPKPGQEPRDRVDEAALRHDISYTRYPDLKSRVKADHIMIKELWNIRRPTRRERCERCLTLFVLLFKTLFESLFLKLFCK